MQTESVGSQAAASGTAQKSLPKNPKGELGKDEFLKLLVTQLEHQDPLNPTDNTEFVAQLAQFSSLEGITNMSKSMEDATKSIDSMYNYSAANFIGKSAKVDGDTFEFGGYPVSLGFSLEKPAADVQLRIADSLGRTVKKIGLGQKGAGEFNLTWDGVQQDGKTAPEGIYKFYLSAKAADKSPVGSSTFVKAPVSGVNFESGKAVMKISGSEVPVDKLRELTW